MAGIVAAIGISALSPAEMIEWSGRVRQIKQDVGNYREKLFRQEQLEKTLEKLNAELKAALMQLSIDALKI